MSKAVAVSVASEVQGLAKAHKVTAERDGISFMAVAITRLVGDVVEQTGSYTPGVAVAGVLPLLGLGALLLLWGQTATQKEPLAHER